MKPFPWPSVRFDPAAIAAAAAFNLLLVFAFLTPTRGAVATIVREKELRLREGMRILGLKVSSAAMACYPSPVLASMMLTCARPIPLSSQRFPAMPQASWLEASLPIPITLALPGRDLAILVAIA